LARDGFLKVHNEFCTDAGRDKGCR
jgi:hypothetical protein